MPLSRDWARYVGLGRWSLLWLPGRTVPDETAQTAIRAAETLQQLPPPDDKAWKVIRAGADVLGLTLREFTQSLAIECEIPSVPPAIPSMPRTAARDAFRWLWFRGRG